MLAWPAKRKLVKLARLVFSRPRAEQPFGAVTTSTLAIQVAAQIGGSRAPTVASDCDAASLAFQNVCFLPNLAQADDHRAKASERYCAR